MKVGEIRNFEINENKYFIKFFPYLKKKGPILVFTNNWRWGEIGNFKENHHSLEIQLTPRLRIQIYQENGDKEIYAQEKIGLFWRQIDNVKEI